MRFSFTADEAEWALIAVDQMAAGFVACPEDGDEWRLAEILQLMRKLIKQIPPERMPKLRMKFTDREWNKKMHGCDEEGDLGKPVYWRIRPQPQAAA